MKKKTNKNTKVTSISKGRKPVRKQKRKVKHPKVNNVDLWIEEHFNSFIQGKNKLQVKTAYVLEDMRWLTMVYRGSDTEKEAVPREGYIYCKLWGTKKSRLYMYKGRKNKIKAERNIAQEAVILMMPLVLAAAAVLGGYLWSKSSAVSDEVETVQEAIEGTTEGTAEEGGVGRETTQDTASSQVDS